MTTPPVPQWAVDAAKAHFADMFKLFECDPDAPEQMGTVMDLARIIAAHAPRSDEDGERLDWLEEHACEVGRTMAMPRYSYHVKQWSGDPGPNIRSAIDAAMKKDL